MCLIVRVFFRVEANWNLCVILWRVSISTSRTLVKKNFMKQGSLGVS